MSQMCWFALVCLDTNSKCSDLGIATYVALDDPNVKRQRSTQLNWLRRLVCAGFSGLRAS